MPRTTQHRPLKREALLLITALLSIALQGCPGTAEVPRQTPVIEVTYPESAELVSVRRVQVRGTADFTDEVMVNGVPASVVGKRWTAQVPFEEGEAVVTVTARGAEESVSFRIDATPPELVVTSPARASFHPLEAGSSVRVEGAVTDGRSDIVDLRVDDTPIDVGEGGAFSFERALSPGLNKVEVMARDEAGHESRTTIGLIHGAFVEPTERIDPGFDFTIDASIFPKITSVLAALITPEQITSLVEANFDEESAVSLESITFAPLEITAIPKSSNESGEPGFIAFSITAREVELKGAFALSGGEDIGLTATLTEATVTTAMTLLANDDGGLDIAFSQPELTIGDEALSWSVSAGGTDLSDEDSRLLSNLVDRVIELAFSELLSEQIIEQLYDPALLNRRIELLGRTLEFELRLEEIITNASGVFVGTSFAMPADAFGEIPQAPGALFVEAGPTAIPGVSGDAIITADANALNRTLHGVWRSGLLNQRLTGQDFAGFELPIALEAGALALALDGRVLDYADSGSPAGVALRPQLPPVIKLRSAEGGPSEQGDKERALIANFGEVHVDLLLDAEGGSPTKLATFALFMELGVDVEIREGNQIALTLSFSGGTDLIDEPLFDLDDERVEELMQGIFAQIPPLLSEELVLNGEADITWITVTDPQVSVHGLASDQLSIGLTVEANPDGITLP